MLFDSLFRLESVIMNSLLLLHSVASLQLDNINKQIVVKDFKKSKNMF